MFPAQAVIDFSDRLIGIPVVIELVRTVQGSAVKFDVTVDVFLIHMGSDKELVLPAGKLQSKLISQLICVLRRNFPRLKGLDNQVGDHIVFRCAFTAGFRFVDLLAESKFLPCGICAALIGGHQQPVFRLFRILVIVNPVFQNRRNTPAFTGVAGVDF